MCFSTSYVHRPVTFTALALSESRWIYLALANLDVLRYVAHVPESRAAGSTRCPQVLSNHARDGQTSEEDDGQPSKENHLIFQSFTETQHPGYSYIVLHSAALSTIVPISGLWSPSQPHHPPNSTHSIPVPVLQPGVHLAHVIDRRKTLLASRISAQFLLPL